MPSTETVAAGAPRQFGEPVTAGSAVPVVAATAFDAGSVVHTWSRSVAGWVPGPSLLPAGYGESYDPAAAVLPDGRSLLVVGTSRAGACIDGGGLAVATVSAAGTVGAARVVNAPAIGFDDRPTVAAGGGTVWLGWSHGAEADACQPVGADDVVQLARSTDAGATFGPVRTLPSVTGGGAFGVRIAPLPHGEALAAWVESTATEDALVVARLGPAGVLSGPQLIARAPAAPLVLPGSSFYTFITPSVAALPDGRATLAWAPWDGLRATLSVLTGRVGGDWQPTTVPPPAGADLLAPDCAAAGAGRVWCLVAEHRRDTDAVGYDLAPVDVAGQRPRAGSLREVAAGRPGPGYFEFGEETQLSRWRGRLSAAAVLAGRTASTLTWWSWSLPATPGTGARSARPTARPARPRSRGTGNAAAGAATYPWAAAGLAGLGMLAAAARFAARRRR